VRVLFRAAGWSLAGALLVGSPAAAVTKRPNVLLIVIDTLRADHLASYGYARATSPNLDRLAAEGTLYENAISASSWTLPAHASLFTGLPVRDHGTQGNHWTLEPSFDTLAERFQRSGFHTAGFSNNVWTNDASGLKQGFDTFEEMWHGHQSRGKTIALDDPAFDMGAAKTNERVFSFLDDLKDERPFFIFINYFEPHMPYRPTRPFDVRFLPPGAAAPHVMRLRSFYPPRRYGYNLRVPTLRAEESDLAILTGLYDGEIAYVDSMVGTLVDGLRARNLLDNTVLVITSDHGEHLGEHHLLEHKFSLYEPLVRVPLIVRAPGKVPARMRIAPPVQAHDLFGTVLALSGAGAGTARALPGSARDTRLDTPAGNTFAELEFPRIFLEVMRREYSGWDVKRFERSLTAVRGLRYKLISGSDGSVELYDLVADPAESRNLSATEPKVLAELKAALDSFLSQAPPREPGASPK